MIFFDLLFYTFYYYLSRKYGRGEYSSKLTGLYSMAIYFPFFGFTFIMSIIGLIWDNKMSRWIWEKDNGFWTTISIGTIFLYVFYIRYSKQVSAKELTEKVKALQGTKKIILKTLVYLFIIIMPIACFIFCQLYLFQRLHHVNTIFHNG